MRSLYAALLVGMGMLALATPAAAQEGPAGTSYVTPFPEGDIYKLQAYGDAFAEGLLAGLAEAFAGDARVQVSRKHRALSGIARAEIEDELKADEASRETFHIGVIMIGYYDRINMRATQRDRLVLGSAEWRQEYGVRVDRFIKALKRRGLALYWVGQPTMRRFEASDPAQTMNDVVREKAYLNGIRFIDIQAQFADEAGNYTAVGPDITGKQQVLRQPDGALFTPAGNRKLAHFVEQEIKRDLANAKNERAIPLAGSESEQKRINALKPRPAPAADGGWKSSITAARGDDKKGPAATAPAPDPTNEQRADNGRITLRSIGAGGREESVTIDIPRPAIPAAVISLVTRKESSDRPSQTGDVIADDVGGGLVVLNSITPAGGASVGAARRTAPSQMPYYQVLIKGERLPSRPDRADDFSWPKPEPAVTDDPPPPVRRAPRTTSPRTPPRS